MLTALHIPAGAGLIPTISSTLQLGGIGTAVLILLIFIFGTCLGSFANACALRLVRDEDFIFAPSRCRACDRHLPWHENLPVIGYLMLRGKCAGCGISLAPRYILVEIFMGLFLVTYALFLPVSMAIGFGIALAIIAITSLTDLESMVLHPALLATLGTIGLCFTIAGQLGLFPWHLTSAQSLLGILIAGGFPLAINGLYRVLRGQNGFGEGDFWMMAAIGAWLGPLAGIALFILASWIGAAAGILMMVRRKATVSTRLPFGLFAGGAFILWPNLFTRVF